MYEVSASHIQDSNCKKKSDGNVTSIRVLHGFTQQMGKFSPRCLSFVNCILSFIYNNVTIKHVLFVYI